jgi:FCD domain-containing protein
MTRRAFITLLGGAAAWPLAARAQQPTKIAHVGWLSAGLDNPVQALGREVLVSTLRRLGFTEGENLILEHRPTDQGIAKAFAGANELVAAKADVLIADGPELAVQAATAARLARLDELIKLQLSASFEERVHINQQFHLMIAEASGSPRLFEMIRGFREYFLNRRWISKQNTKLAKRARDDHKQIVAALRARSPDRVERTLRRHLKLGWEELIAGSNASSHAVP